MANSRLFNGVKPNYTFNEAYNAASDLYNSLERWTKRQDDFNWKLEYENVRFQYVCYMATKVGAADFAVVAQDYFEYGGANDCRTLMDWVSEHATNNLAKVRILSRFKAILGEDEDGEAVAEEKTEEKTEEKVEGAMQTGDGDAALKALGDLVAALAKSSMDEDRVREIVKESAPNQDGVLEIVNEALKSYQPEEARVTVVVEKKDEGVIAEVKNTHKAFHKILLNVSVGNHVYLAGPAGGGKTHVVGQVAEALGRPFYTTGALLTKYEAIGHVDPNGNYHSTAVREAYEHGGILNWDEVDASMPAALVALNAMLSNDVYQFPDKAVNRHPDFVVIASGNTYGRGADREYVGRMQLDAATLDRFAFISFEYDNAVEDGIARAEFEAHGGEDFAKLGEWIAKVRNTRELVARHKLRMVVSPRASQMGARLLARGCSIEDAFEMLIAKGVNEDTRSKLAA